MTFLLSGPFLALFALAAIPLIVHLVARHRPAPFVFGSLRFLRRAATRVQRRRRPKDLLLLLLRTLAVAALIAAALGPRLSLGEDGRDGDEHTVVIVMDRSGSMGAPEGARTRMGVARDRAAAILKSSGATRANLVMADARPAPVYPIPGVNLDTLADEIRKAETRPERADTAAAMRLALDQLAKGKGSKELVIISDFALSEWKEGGPALPTDLKTLRLRAAEEEPDNLAVSSLRCRPAVPVAGTDGEILCRISNHSDAEAHTTVFLEIGEARLSRPVVIPARGATDIAVPHRFAASGLVPIRAILAEDRFPRDNRRQLLVRVPDATPFRIETAAGRAAPESLLRALSAHPWLRADTRGDRADLVWVADWDGSDPARLLALAESGQGVVVAPGPGCPASALAALFGTPASPDAPSTTTRRLDAGWSVRITRPDHPLFSTFAKGEFGDPIPGRFREKLTLPPDLVADESRILARFDDGAPALILRDTPRGGGILLWNLPLAPALADWTSRPAFVVMLGEIAARLPVPAAPEDSDTRPGAPVSWALPKGADASQITLVTSDARPVPTTLRSTPDGPRLESAAGLEPDLYTWRVNGTAAHFSAVNFPVEESDLRIVRDSKSATGASHADPVGAAEAENYMRLREGRPLTHAFAIAALLLFFAELALARFAAKSDGEAAAP